jgi:lipoate---protein ligase
VTTSAQPAGPRPADDPVQGAWDLDRDLIETVRQGGGPQIAVYPHPDLVCVIGHGGDPWRETRPELLAADGVPLRRRRGGGCAVVLDPGNLICSIVLPWPGVGAITRAFDLLGEVVGAGLAACGLPGVHQQGTSDLALGDRKLGGSCIWRTRNLLYYSTTLLVDPDWGRIDRYLPHPPREPDYRAGRDHHDFLTSTYASGLRTPPGRLAAALAAYLARQLPALAPPGA